MCVLKNGGKKEENWGKGGCELRRDKEERHKYFRMRECTCIGFCCALVFSAHVFAGPSACAVEHAWPCVCF